MLKQINRIICFIFISMVSFASSETKKAMTIVDLINVPSLGDPRLSPDGGQLLYTLSEDDWGKMNASATSGESTVMAQAQSR